MGDGRQSARPSRDLDIKAQVWEAGSGKKAKKDDHHAHRSKQDTSEDESPRKLRERASWLTGSRSAGAVNLPQGQWRSVTLRLGQSDPSSSSSSFQLSVFSNDSSRLLYSVFLQALSLTDIRPAHHSLLSRKYVIGLHCRHRTAWGIPIHSTNPGPGQSPDWLTSAAQGSPWALPAAATSAFHFTESSIPPPSPLPPPGASYIYAPLYIGFRSQELHDAYLALLRTYTLPETYGTFSLSEVDRQALGGLYRIWRGIELEIVEGRDLLPSRRRNASPTGSAFSKSDYTNDHTSTTQKEHHSSSDHDIYCEVYLDSLLCGRTTIKRASPSASHTSSAFRGDATTVWNERFQWPDLPAHNRLAIKVWKIKSDKEKQTSPQSSMTSTGGHGHSHAPSRLKSSVTTSVALISGAGGVSRKERERVLVGEVQIVLPSFRRAEWVEGWFGVLSVSPFTSPWGHGTPELKLKLKVEEVTVRPASAYEALSSILQAPGAIRLFSASHSQPDSALDPRGTSSLPAAHLSLLTSHLHHISLATATLIPSLCHAISAEVASFADNLASKSSTSPNTLFRGNTIITKTVEFAMMRYGKPWLDKSLGKVLLELIDKQVALETDPGKIERRAKKDHAAASEGAAKELENNVKALVYWCDRTWKSIWNAREECPSELRVLFETIRIEVSKHFNPPSAVPRHRQSKQQLRLDYDVIVPDSETEQSTKGGTYQSDLKWQALSAFVFLRFFVPAILHPHLFGLVEGLPPPGVHRTLKLIAKVLQSLANLNLTGHKDDHMRSVKNFLDKEKPTMVDYLYAVSTRKGDLDGASAVSSLRGNPRTADYEDVVEALDQRLPRLSALHRESLPALPHKIDSPLHLAMIASTVVRNAKGAMPSIRTDSAPGGDSQSCPQSDWGDFQAACVEAMADTLSCVDESKFRTVAHDPPPEKQRRSRSVSKPRGSSSTKTPKPERLTTKGSRHSLHGMPSTPSLSVSPTQEFADNGWPVPPISTTEHPLDLASRTASASPTPSASQPSTMSSILVMYRQPTETSSEDEVSESGETDGMAPSAFGNSLVFRSRTTSRPSTAPSTNSSKDSQRRKTLREQASFNNAIPPYESRGTDPISAAPRQAAAPIQPSGYVPASLPTQPTYGPGQPLRHITSEPVVQPPGSLPSYAGEEVAGKKSKGFFKSMLSKAR